MGLYCRNVDYISEVRHTEHLSLTTSFILVAKCLLDREPPRLLFLINVDYSKQTGKHWRSQGSFQVPWRSPEFGHHSTVDLFVYDVLGVTQKRC